LRKSRCTEFFLFVVRKLQLVDEDLDRFEVLLLLVDDPLLSPSPLFLLDLLSRLHLRIQVYGGRKKERKRYGK
jgi:hypothetical protein